LKVLQICAAYKPAFIYGGPTMSVSMLSEQLVKAGFVTEVFATTANGKNELPVLPGLPVNVDGVTVRYFKRLTKDHTHFSPALLRALWKECRSYDLIHIHAWWNLVSLFSCMIALTRKVPVLVSPRGTLSRYSFQNKNIGVKWFIHNLWGKYLLNSSHLHVTSARENEAIKSIIHPKSIVILPNFVKLSSEKQFEENSPSPYLRLLFFSRIEEKKGLDILLNALPGVTVPYRLTIAGDGDESYIEYLKSIAKKNNTNDQSDWIGFQSDDKFKLLHSHDLLVLPSHDENFGNVVIESLSVGTAVLISEQVGLADYVRENNLGWICKANPAAVGEAINTIAKDQQQELKRIRKDVPGIIYNDFNEDNLVKKYIGLYKQLIKQ
jgi:glycosyltransferase involved in cell wall biosynthesis